MPSFERPTPPHHEQAQSTADAPENSSRRDFFRNMVGIAAVTAYDAVTGRPAKAAEDVLEGLGSLATRKERGDGDREVETGEDSVYGEVEQLVGEPTVEDLTLEHITNEVKKRYGITLRFSGDPEMIKEVNRIGLRAAFKLIDQGNEQGVIRAVQEMDVPEKVTMRIIDALKRYKQAKNDQQKSAIESEIIASDVFGLQRQGYENKALSSKEKMSVAERIYENLQLYPDDTLKTIAAEHLQMVVESSFPQKTFFHRMLSFVGKRAERESQLVAQIQKANKYSGMYSEPWANDSSKIVLRTTQENGNNVPSDLIHHELFHLFDQVFYNNIAMYRNNDGDEIEDWRTEHREEGGIAYKDNADNDWLHDSLDDELNKKGFIKDVDYGEYSRTNPLEDRAVIAQLLFARSPDAILYGEYERAAKDPIVAKKIEKIKDDYWHWSGGIMDDAYWKLLEKGDLDGAREYVQRRSREQHGEQYSEQEKSMHLSTEQLAQQQRRKDEQAAQDILEKIKKMK